MEEPRIPSDFRFETKLTVRWSDEDHHRVVNNAVYLTLMEEARLAYFTELGLMEDGRFPFVLAQANVVFVRPGRGGRSVNVAARTTQLGNSSLGQAYRISDAETGEVWCVGEARLVAWDIEAKEKRNFPDAWRETLSRYESDPELRGASGT